ncbi:MAG: NAD-dependent dihydropyrimidine dehydrogenase subunit PreA [Erysipelotrichaceae bacterium]|nr:NAD-dependent dihydropyrimidine dehydrogenase subunit PreA [Erysipelotrichaceae bacterium]
MKLENPFLLSSSVVASNYEMCAKAFEQGFAGACFKTICLFEQHETSPRFSALKSQNGSFYGFKNIEQLSDHSLEENLVVFGQLKEKYPDKIIIASIMGRNEKEWEYLARECDKAGADVIECNFSCPNMEESALGVTIGQSEELTKRFTAAARKGTKKPLLAKMTPNITDMVPVAIAAKEGGADGIAAINTIKSITSVNIDTLAPLPSVKGKSSPGGYSGSAVKPIALRFISDMSNCEDLQDMHISGMGGITTWRDALEFLLLGCGSLQITTAVMQYGYRIVDDLTAGLKGYMRERNIKDLYQLIGAAKENIVELDELERDTILYPKFRNEQYIGCGRCYISCYDGGHQAIRFDETNRRPILDAKKCVGCHLCLLVCPAKAITTAIRRVKKMTS